ncbi:MAG: MiaB/RimO family radical SAM methylthiotransferase [Oscillospiraceae bacterium]|nr:MiaB/RimO family radical SAM methylthiotransferase [Oscillospiraceae bacterium]
MRVIFCTLGCKANQADSGSMGELLRLHGHKTVSAPPCDAVIVNTCAVTAEASRKSRAAIRALRAKYPNAVLGVCGCLPGAAGLSSFPGADVVGSARNVRAFLKDLERAAGVPESPADAPAAVSESEGWESMPAAPIGGRARAYIKIQDGCENFCSYCVIPRTRGAARSMPLADVLAQARALRGKGFLEIVLTGIEISSYKEGLPALVSSLARELPDTRVRLGSLEPGVLTEENIRALSEAPTLCPHFHVSLQSGSDSVLRRMNRRYDTADYARAVACLRRFFPGAAITTDLICGFPGESGEEWAETMAFIKETGFADMHVFPYSRRPDTPAADMPGQLSRAVKKTRAAQAAYAADEMTRAYRQGQIGRTLRVLFETEGGGMSLGHSENYIPVSVSCTSGLRGSIRDAEITGFDEKGAALCGLIKR